MALSVIAAFILLTIFGAGDDFKGIRDMRFGIDIRGGVEAVFEPAGTAKVPSEKQLEAARNVIESRLDAENITDREVTVDKSEGHIIVRFPWKSDEKEFNPEAAISELGETAKLTFRDPKGNILVEGENVADSSVTRNRDTGEYEVALQFDRTGAEAFAKATQELVGKQMGIYMDELMISNPKVNQVITGGQAVINGMENYDAAKALSDKINSGALPFSMKTSNYNTIQPQHQGWEQIVVPDPDTVQYQHCYLYWLQKRKYYFKKCLFRATPVNPCRFLQFIRDPLYEPMKDKY